MPTWLLVTIILLIGCFTTAYVTSLINNKEHESEWQEITYAGGSIEPKDIYICKNCNYQADMKYHYCCNCGSEMINGISRHYFSEKIKISE